MERILTLRYDPFKTPSRVPLQSKDFTPAFTDGNESAVEKIMKNNLIKEREHHKFSHVSLALSGGVDSSLTLAMIKLVFPDVKVSCVSLGFGDSDDEIEDAREIARALDCDFQSIIRSNFLVDLPKLINIVKEPRINLYQYYVLEHGKKNSDFFFTGDGGDELFAGYTFRYMKYLSLLKEDSSAKEKVAAYLSCHERDWVPEQEEIFGSAVKFAWEDIYNILIPYFENDLSPLDQVFLADYNGKLLFDWLPVNNAYGKNLKLKIFSLFLTDDIVNFATHVPWHLKYDPKSGVGKMILRSLLSKQKFFNQFEPTKKGFSVDLISLWNKNGREIVDTYVNAESEVVRNNIINPAWVEKTKRKLTENSKLESRYINKILSVLSLEVWYRLFISGTMNKQNKL